MQSSVVLQLLDLMLGATRSERIELVSLRRFTLSTLRSAPMKSRAAYLQQSVALRRKAVGQEAPRVKPQATMKKQVNVSNLLKVSIIIYELLGRPPRLVKRLW